MQQSDSVQEWLDGQVRELARLRALESEYRVTLKVLALAVERLLAATGAERLEIDDQAMTDTPDLVAWREHDAARVVIAVAR